MWYLGGVLYFVFLIGLATGFMAGLWAEDYFDILPFRNRQRGEKDDTE